MPFEKGKSGNPGGRPKENEEVKALARAHGPEAIAKLVEIMQTGDNRSALSAAVALLDRAYGKPAQAITGEGGQPLQISIQASLADETL